MQIWKLGSPEMKSLRLQEWLRASFHYESKVQYGSLTVLTVRVAVTVRVSRIYFEPSAYMSPDGPVHVQTGSGTALAPQ